ncbi:hypothetical protein GCM10009859_21050 [Kocuria salsicia]
MNGLEAAFTFISRAATVPTAVQKDVRRGLRGCVVRSGVLVTVLIG